ncbi:MAG TPA: hypothetical protein PLO62_01790 [Candidatus Hydrogenedentes bacterium]|nr:hypothetical protein [Candidatus Hydrogenedentota bacterium]HOS02962.1 hypothetical protein [Candidatus Hydrogenedentota bacterium]
MADDSQGKDKGSKRHEPGEPEQGFISDSGLGNLPPLSDFDSSAGGSAPGSMPPMGAFESDSGVSGGFGGLPPISDIPVETPVPTGGNVRPAPPQFEDTPMFDTPITDSNLRTPEHPRGRGGYQNQAADSDFTPETPEIGPGPDSDLDTPMFDSAFGGGTSNLGAPDTSAPTQAMETPMFGVRPQDSAAAPGFSDQFGFDDGAFGTMPSAPPSFGEGTPIPDFSPDTMAGVSATPQPGTEIEAKKKPRAKGGMATGAAVLVGVITLILGLLVGVLSGTSMAPKLSFLPDALNPAVKQADELRKKVSSLEADLAKVVKNKPPEGVDLSPEAMSKLIEDRDIINTEIAELTSQRDAVKTECAQLGEEQAALRGKIESLNEEFASNQQKFEELVNQSSIVRARRDGLESEVERLQGLVGRLAEANDRSQATRDALAADVERLAVTVRESIPLTPKKYNYEGRVAAVDQLKSKVASAKWVDPQLLAEYTSLYLSELEISGKREYFFARIPVTDRYGSTWLKWAECVMNGNWSVYYRTLDGKNIGAYERAPDSGPTPRYAFIENLPTILQKQIEDQVVVARVAGYQDTIRMLAQKEEVQTTQTPFQRVFDSL